MMMHNKHIMKESRCSVCGCSVMVDEIGNGEVCQNCGWRQDAFSEKFPRLSSLILIPLDKARRLYKEGKPLKPDFEDFIDFYEMYGEVEFTYNKAIYGMVRTDNDAIRFWACDEPLKGKVPVVFASVDDFVTNAKIGDVLVKDLWDKVENPGSLK